MSEVNANKKNRIEELVEILNQASEAYYNGQDEIMSNYEWDAMFDELSVLEVETGYVLSNSPTQNTGYESVSGKKEQHEFAALSLAKTKKIEELVKWAEDYPIWLSWKLDGCTLVLTYAGSGLCRGRRETGSRSQREKAAERDGLLALRGADNGHYSESPLYRGKRKRAALRGPRTAWCRPQP